MIVEYFAGVSYPPFDFEKSEIEKTEAPRFVENTSSRMRGVVSQIKKFYLPSPAKF